MPRIHRLPLHLANQIAAGEVVERPASVVKELIENALDAGARRISVAIEFGGKKLIRVEDDGEGMDAGGCAARDRAARDEQDHDAGGPRRDSDARVPRRGAAKYRVGLALHAAHARARRATGTEIRVNGGTVSSEREVGAPEGTCIEVADLFYNLPARRKFLKSDTAETTQVSKLLTQLALGYPEIGFTLTSGPRKLLECPPVARARRAVLPDVRRARRSDRDPQGGRRA